MNASQCYVVLAVTLAALAISVSFNIVFCCLRWRNRRKAGLRECVSSYPMEQYSEGEHDQLQENPIYGNINPERGATQAPDLQDHMLYEHMKVQPGMETMNQAEELHRALCMFCKPSNVDRGNCCHSGCSCCFQTPRLRGRIPTPAVIPLSKCLQPTHLDVAYASLDLAGAKKGRKKQKTKQGQAQARHLTHSLSQQEFLEVDTDRKTNMPSRQSSPMVSRHSIYLNSHQMVLEAQELEREQAWEREQKQEQGREREWEQQREWERDLKKGRDRVPDQDLDWERDLAPERDRDRGWKRELEWEKDLDQEAAQQLEQNSGLDYDIVHEDPTHFLRPRPNQNFEPQNL